MIPGLLGVVAGISSCIELIAYSTTKLPLSVVIFGEDSAEVFEVPWPPDVRFDAGEPEILQPLILGGRGLPVLPFQLSCDGSFTTDSEQVRPTSLHVLNV